MRFILKRAVGEFDYWCLIYIFKLIFSLSIPRLCIAS